MKKRETEAEDKLKIALPSPVLTRLGTLRELTRGFIGMGKDGGPSGMSFPG